MSVLSNDQKARLCQAAGEAWAAAADREEWLEANAELSASKVQEAWRRYHQAKAVGQSSLRLCTQDDYLRLMAYWQVLAGKEVAATRTTARAETDPKRRAWHLLVRALQERSLPLAYAASICRRSYKCALSDATEKQLWNLLYTVRNRRKPAKAA